MRGNDKGPPSPATHDEPGKPALTINFYIAIACALAALWLVADFFCVAPGQRALVSEYGAEVCGSWFALVMAAILVAAAVFYFWPRRRRGFR